MIAIKCCCCTNELDRAGALIFSPPFHEDDVVVLSTFQVHKVHVCNRCWVLLVRWLDGQRLSADNAP
jgi:hypothetical protein